MGLGNCAKNRCCESATLAEYENVTEVDNPASPPATVPPYSRPEDATVASCSLGCGPWPYAPAPRPKSGDEEVGDAYHDDNLLHPTGSDVTLQRCREGHKIVQAIKQWHGVQDFLSKGCVDCTEQTRYRTVRRKVQIDMTVVVEGYPSPYESTNGSGGEGYVVEREYTVDRYSGKITSDPLKCVTEGYTQTGEDDPVPFDIDDINLYDGGVYISGSNPDAFTVTLQSISGLRQMFQTHGVCGDLVMRDFDDVNQVWTNAEAMELDLFSSGLTPGTYVTITPTYPVSSPLSGNGISWAYDVTVVVDDDVYPPGKITLTAAITITVELTNEYSFAALTTDCEDMLDEWALNVSSYFPWRTDAWRAHGVLLTYREHGARDPDTLNQSVDGIQPCSVDDYESPIGSPPYSSWDPRDWFDSASYTWIFNPGEDETTEAALELRLNPANDGSMKGKPFTTGWPDRIFDWDHKTWVDEAFPSGPDFVIHYRGAWSGETNNGDTTDSVIPDSASQWTDNLQAGILPAGAVSLLDVDATNHIGNGALFLQKYVEDIVTFPRHNFFRPCGADRWMMDTTKASCITAATATPYAEDVVLTTTDDLSGDISAGDLIAIYQEGSTAQVFPVKTITGTSVTLDAELLAPEGIADTYAEWDAAFADPDNSTKGTGTYGILGKLRWPDNVAGLKGAICGRINIASATQNGADLDLVLSSAASYLRTGDKIVFCDNDASDTILDDNSTAGFSAVVSDPTHVTIAGLTRNATNHTKCIKSLGAPASVWNTTASRKDYVAQTWDTDATTGGFEATPTNTDGSHTGKIALAFSPNLDTSASWINGTMPECLPLTCGGRAASIYIQRIIDPLWQIPVYCNSGTLAALIACPPYVEAMTDTKRDAIGAPALPSGTSLDDMLPSSSASLIAGHVDDTIPNAHDAPWIPCV